MELVWLVVDKINSTENFFDFYSKYLLNEEDKESKYLQRIMKEYMMRGKYSPVNQGHYGLGIDGYVRISSAARRAMDALALSLIHI